MLLCRECTAAAAQRPKRRRFDVFHAKKDKRKNEGQNDVVLALIPQNPKSQQKKFLPKSVDHKPFFSLDGTSTADINGCTTSDRRRSSIAIANSYRWWRTVITTVSSLSPDQNGCFVHGFLQSYLSMLYFFDLNNVGTNVDMDGTIY